MKSNAYMILTLLLASSLAHAMPGVLLKDEVLRSAPQTEASEVTRLNRNDSVEIEDRSGGWLLISSGAAKGWVRILSVRGAGNAAPGNNLSRVKSVFLPSGNEARRVVAVAGLRSLDEAQRYAEQAKAAQHALDADAVSRADIIAFAQARQLTPRELAYFDPPKQEDSGIVRWLKRRDGDAPIKLKNTTLHTALLLGQPTVVDQVRIGAHLAGQILQKTPLLKDDALQRYVNLVGGHVSNHVSAQQNENSALPWHFAVLESDELFSTSTPGGFVFITRGLYQTLDSEDALAAVLGSEIGQVVRNHALTHLKAQAQTLSLSPADNAAGQDSYLADLLGDASQYLSRKHVAAQIYEADRTGLVLATRAGYDPFALVLLLQNLGQIPADNPKMALYQRTRPAPADRLRQLADSASPHWDALSAKHQPIPLTPIRLHPTTPKTQ